MAGSLQEVARAIRSAWKGLCTVGASTRMMLIEAAAQTWMLPASEITTQAGVLYHKKSGKSANYGQIASLAASMPVPKKVKLKEVKSFDLLSTPAKT